MKLVISYEDQYALIEQPNILIELLSKLSYITWLQKLMMAVKNKHRGLLQNHFPKQIKSA